MGTDIHGFIRYKTWQKEWKYVELPPKFDNRDYDFFAILADVRNSYGFAGSARYDKPVKPFTSSRGVPKDFKLDDSTDLWLGDHSFGYISLQELEDNFILANQTINRVGIITLEQYKALEQGIIPDNWPGDIFARDIVKLEPSDITDNVIDLYPGKRIYVNASWQESPFLDKITDLRTFMSLYIEFNTTKDDIQFLFGFDS